MSAPSSGSATAHWNSLPILFFIYLLLGDSCSHSCRFNQWEPLCSHLLAQKFELRTHLHKCMKTSTFFVYFQQQLLYSRNQLAPDSWSLVFTVPVCSFTITSQVMDLHLLASLWRLAWIHSYAFEVWATMPRFYRNIQRLHLLDGTLVFVPTFLSTRPILTLSYIYTME